MKGLDDGQSKVEKSRKVQSKAKPLVLKSQIATKVVLPPKVDETKENAHEMVEDVRDKPHTREDKPKVEDTEEDQVMVDAQILEAKEKAEHTLANDEELYREDEECGDDEYFEELTEEVLEQLVNERKEEMAELDSELKPGQSNSMDEDVFDEVESMVHIGEPKEIKVTRELLKAEVA
ncbi:unnamed protein product [Prunus armeniaca]|uniref:Uncharacterized protein n=1 Tax=Prunus armeniaca TaxID=36596 RepID=A0A6J5VP14_PRUAR|nr:unnamed protein product [Prunus armeniaca]